MADNSAAYAYALEQARSARQERDFGEAKRECLLALRLRPESLEATALLGVLLADEGNPQEGLRLLQGVLDSAPRHFDALIWSSAIYRTQGSAASVDLALRALDVRPEEPEPNSAVGLAYVAMGNHRAALHYLEKAAALRPSYLPYLLNLARTYRILGEWGEALCAYRECLKSSPELREALLGKAEAEVNLARYGDAEHTLAHIIDKVPAAVAPRLLLAQSKGLSGDSEGAIECALDALEIASTADEYVRVGTALQKLGALDTAEQAFMRSIELQPSQIEAYLGLFQGRNAAPEEAHLIDRMLEIEKRGALADADLTRLEYALGKALEDLGRYEESMRHYDKANGLAMASSGRPFDPRSYEALINDLIASFDAHRLADAASGAPTSRLPILICGMVRSGTTLTEQILSAHSAIRGGGEMRYWSDHGSELAECCKRREDSGIEALANDYLAVCRASALGSPHVTDKMPPNCMYLGPLHLALPGVRFVLLRRQPLDTALSIYATPNTSKIGFAHDRRSLVTAFRLHARLMAHWKAVIPRESLIEVRYEELVADPAKVVAELIEFCGLEMEDGCLSPERNLRPVFTPSFAQVRRPIYGGSIERWKKFEPWLWELLELAS